MHSFKKKGFYSLRADANALGGFLQHPFQKTIPTAAPTSLPPAGGIATARSGPFDLEGIVSYSSAYTLVTGRQDEEDGSVATLATAVVEDFNILEVVTAKRIVAQVSVSTPGDGGPRRFSTGGSRFEGLQIAGQSGPMILNPKIHGSNLALTDMRDAAREQIDKLVKSLKSHNDEDAYQWAVDRFGWTTADADVSGGSLLCSLIDGFGGPDPHRGHIVDIPGFGRIFLGELLLYPDSVQLVSIRAELGCPVNGTVTGPATAGGSGGKNH